MPKPNPARGPKAKGGRHPASAPPARAIRAPEAAGLTLIEASAGSGKTWTIAHMVPRFLIQGDIAKLDQLVLATFTEPAAGELRGRVSAVLADLTRLLRSGEKAPEHEPGLAELRADLDALDPGARQAAVSRLERALDDGDRLIAGTIHSFCRRVLVDESFLCGIPGDFTLLKETRALRQRAVRDLRRAGLGDPLLATLATMRAWSVEQDLEFVAKAARRPEVRFEPSLDLDQALDRLRQSLADMASHHAELADYRKRFDGFVAQGVEPSQRPKAPAPEDLAHWESLLKAYDPSAPDPDTLKAALEIRKLPKWLKKTDAPKALKRDLDQAIEGFGHLGVVLAAETVAGLFPDGQDKPDPLHWAWKVQVARAARGLFERALKEANQLDFDGLVLGLRRALLQGPGRDQLRRRLRARWKIALVDESQDTDLAQLEVFRAIFEDPTDGHRLVLIGDPKQSVYSFRGADPRAYAQAKAGAKEQVPLDKNFRAAPGLLRALNAFFHRAEPALGDPDLDVPEMEAARSDAELPLPAPDPCGGARIAVALVPESEREAWGNVEECRSRAAEAVASALVEHLRSGVKPGQCAVLTSTNPEARSVLDALKDRGVPAVILRSGDVFQSEAAEDWRTLLAALLKPGDAGLRGAALATRLLGLAAVELAALAPEDHEAWRLRFTDGLRAWRKRGLPGLLAELESGAWGSPLERLARLHDGERLVTDSRHVLELADAAAQERSLEPEGVLAWIVEESVLEPGEMPPEGRERRLEHDGDAVQIMTTHGAKGLEFDYVFCPCLWSNGKSEGRERLRADADGGWTLLDTKLAGAAGEAAEQATDLERFQERLRLAYVALTRAKRRVWMLAGWVGYKGSRSVQSPSALDWLLRSEPSEGLGDWYALMEGQKKRTLDQDAQSPRAPKACRHEQTLAALEAASDGLIRSFPLRVAAERFEAPRASEPFPQAAARSKPDLGAWETTSFSRLAHEERESLPDPDAAEALLKAEPVQDQESFQEGLPSCRPPAADRRPAFSEEIVPLASFPRGTEPGSCVHRILERWDFQALDSGRVRSALWEFGLVGAENETLLLDALPGLAQSVVPGLNRTLAGAAGQAGLSELEFLLPIAGTAKLDGPRLADLFARHGQGRFKDYARRVRELPGAAVGGMLTGSIDRLARAGNDWCVLDWKSNHLGDVRADYAEERLWENAQDGHYVLQQLLYLVAGRRYLALFGPEHRLERACLAYVRGMSAGSTHGLLELKPPLDLLQALDRLFAPARGRA